MRNILSSLSNTGRRVLITLLVVAAITLFSLVKGYPNLSSSQTGYPTKKAPSVTSYFAAVALVDNSATRVEVFLPSDSKNRVSIGKDEPWFAEIIQYLENCTLGDTNQKTKTVTEGGTTKIISLNIIHPRGHYLEFKLQDGKWLLFEVENSVWFETNETIYNAFCEPSFKDLLNAILPRT